MSSYSAERSGQRIDELPAVPLDAEIARALRRLLFALAEEQDLAAAHEASSLPYWKACPASLLGTRAAARVLREAAERVPVVSGPA
ncbi:MAG: hypothetical protein ACTHJM_02245 [Marmoricola sp.]